MGINIVARLLGLDGFNETKQKKTYDNTLKTSKTDEEE
tara:strand:- start:283 stop:396 length:114 start_codon:yes stop_codon:yes gene_type:complete